jgi:hypothetical protein
VAGYSQAALARGLRGGIKQKAYPEKSKPFCVGNVQPALPIEDYFIFGLD